MGVLKGNRSWADLRYYNKDNVGASTFISAAIEDFNSPYPAKGTLEQKSLRIPYYTKLVLHKLSITSFNQQ